MIHSYRLNCVDFDIQLSYTDESQIMTLENPRINPELIGTNFEYRSKDNKYRIASSQYVQIVLSKKTIYLQGDYINKALSWEENGTSKIHYDNFVIMLKELSNKYKPRRSHLPGWF